MSEKQRSALALCGFMAGFFVAWTIRATILYPIDESIGSPALKTAYADLLKFLLWVVPAAAFVYWGKGIGPAEYWGLGRSPGRIQWTRCLVVIAGFLLVTAGFEVGSARQSFSAAALGSTSVIVGLLSLGVSPLLEELLFRGFVMKELLGLMPLALANGVTSLLFVGAHLPYWLSHGGMTASVAANCAGILVFSLLAGWLFAKSRSVWPPVVAHVANNVLAIMLAGRPGMA